MTAICRTGSEPNVLDSHVHHNSKPLSEAQKLRKVIMELIETERAYVKVRQRSLRGKGSLSVNKKYPEFIFLIKQEIPVYDSWIKYLWVFLLKRV